jgi:hypothetical protein
MAYGQTGSGKSFTMGSEAHSELELSAQTGLIPRFMNELFQRLQRKKQEQNLKQNKRKYSCDDNNNNTNMSPQLIQYILQASFLEVYGEDVHDLLDDTESRQSLHLREDPDGGLVVRGLTTRKVDDADAALAVLHEGTLNRKTATTLMNLTSSRSQAVFTVTLQQVLRNKTTGMDVTNTSRFTFFDLAGSERMKKTGAEGERAQEGIKINEGLLALGNVINALADDERHTKERKVHVPYRQSKLTRLCKTPSAGTVKPCSWPVSRRRIRMPVKACRRCITPIEHATFKMRPRKASVPIHPPCLLARQVLKRDCHYSTLKMCRRPWRMHPHYLLARQVLKRDCHYSTLKTYPFERGRRTYLLQMTRFQRRRRP